MSRGGHFGEIALLRNVMRTTTCTAIDHVELIVISRADFELLARSFPKFLRRIEAAADVRNEPIHQRDPIRRGFDFKELADQQLMQGHSLLLFDTDRCTRCDECVRACADSHGGVTRLRREGLRFDKYFVPTSCRSCRDPVCLTECPVGSIGRSATGAIIIEDWCIGCRRCEENCPYGSIRMHQDELRPGEQIYRQQRPVRRTRVHFRAPQGLDMSTLPFGLEYDSTDGWLSYAGVTRAAKDEELLAFSDDASYRQAVRELVKGAQTVVQLPVLPKLTKPPTIIEGLIKAVAGPPATVSFFGVVDDNNAAAYRGLSSDGGYLAAVDQAARESRGAAAVISKAVVCDLCESVDKVPRCVYACPHDAAHRVDGLDFFRREGMTR
jgi:Fe-S-cluster-containing hydrogenase component 2